MNLFKKDIALYLIADKNIHFRNIYDIPFCLVKHIFNSATDSSIAFCFFKRYSSNSESCCINLCKACIRLGSRSFVNLSMNLFMTPPQFTSSSLQIRLLTESRRFLYSSCIFFFLFLASRPRNFRTEMGAGFKAIESPKNATTKQMPAVNSGNHRGEVARTT